MSRQNFFHLALVSLVPLLVAVELNSLEMEWAVYLWVFGIILMLVAIGGLQKTIGKDNLDPVSRTNTSVHVSIARAPIR